MTGKSKIHRIRSPPAKAPLAAIGSMLGIVSSKANTINTNKTVNTSITHLDTTLTRLRKDAGRTGEIP